MTFAFDYDGTLKSSAYYDLEECSMWARIISVLRSHGHQVVIVTSRTGSEADRMEVYRWTSLACIDIPVIYCGERGLKDEVCRSEGCRVDIWVDDMPDSIRQPVPMIGMGGE